MGKISVTRFPERLHVFEAPLIPRIALAALTMEFDLLHVNGMNPTITDLAIIFARLRRKPVVVTYHNDAETHIWGRLGRLANYFYAFAASVALSLATVVVCTTGSYASTSRSLRFCGQKLKVIPPGVNADAFKHIDPHGPDVDPKKLLFVGQLKEYKGVHVLLETLANLHRDGHKVKLDVVGTGPESRRLKTMAEDLALDGHVSFRGNVEEHELPSLYANCKAFVLPSLNRREAFGLVLLDALAAGKPIVATELPGVKEVVQMAGGYLAKPNDPASLATSILQALNSSDGAEKYRAVAQKLSWGATVDRYESVFQTLVSSNQ
jgi:glycosyltransferase involved in cell wall biosynthesis